MIPIALIEDDEDIIACTSNDVADIKYVAVTAEGAYALEKRCLPFIKPTQFLKQEEFARLAHRLFDQLCNDLEQIESEVPAYRDLLRNNLYNIFYEFIGLVARAYILGSAIVASRSSGVVAFGQQKNGRLGQTDVMASYQQVCSAMNVPLSVLPKTPKPSSHGSRSIWVRAFLRNIQIAWSYFTSWRKSAVRQLRVSDDTGSLLYIGGASYDWQVFRDYARWCLPNYAHYTLERNCGSNPWDVHSTSLYCYGKRGEQRNFSPLSADVPLPELTHHIGHFFVTIGGSEIDFGGVLSGVIKEISSRSRSILEHSRSVAANIVERISPSAVCFSEMTSVCSRALCQEFNRLGVPTIYYQNGGVYGSQQCPVVEEMAQGYTRYFFSYGPAILPRNPVQYSSASEFVPVGSIRLYDLKLLNTWRARRKRATQAIRILWISEGTTRNTIGFWYQLEDVARFDLQRQGLDILAAADNVKVVYRPIPSQIHALATPAWLGSNYPNVTIDDFSESRYLISAADIIICDVHSNTSWDEALVCGKPLIAFVDEKVTLLRTEYVEAVSTACVWCSTADDFMRELRSLASDPVAYLKGYRKDASAYLKQYADPGTNSIPALLDIVAASARNRCSGAS